MTDEQLRDELDQWKMVRYRIEDEGMEYCFRHYSSFSDIEDEEFHRLRLNLIQLMDQIEQFVENKITEIENKLEE
jgi:hypothetical protein